MELTNTACGIPSGFPSLDRITDGWQQSNLIVIASRPSVGKTTFALTIARNAAVDFNIPVAFFSVEMSSSQLASRLIIQESGPAKEDEWESRDINTTQWQQLEGRLQKLSKAPLYIDDTPGLSVKDFREKANKLVKDKNIRLIVVDYLQLMTAPEEFFDQREQEEAYVASALKSTAKELEVPIIVLSQLSRTFHPGPMKPELRDIREFETIVEAADLVSIIEKPEDKEMAELIIAKNSNGNIAEVPMLFMAEILQFENLTEIL